MKNSLVRSLLMAAVLTLGAVMPGLAASIGGATRGEYTIAAHSTRTFTRSFYAGEPARVGVHGDGDTDLDLYIYDEAGNLVAVDDDSTDICYVEWTPRWTGRFTIRIVNRGDVYNDFEIGTN